VAYRIVLRQDIAANWSNNNPLLLSGELGFETDTKRIKLGNGTDRWNVLPYYLRPGFYGHFYDTTFQGVGATGEAYYVRCNTSNISEGVYVTGATAGPSGATGNFRYVVENPGVYEVSLTGNLKQNCGITGSTGSTGSVTSLTYIWLSKNGTDVPYSSQSIQMSGSTSNPDYTDINFSYPVSMSADDYLEIKYGSEDCTSMAFEPATADSSRPWASVPSVSVTITQVG
jgi:hypothetical protein